MPGYRGGYQTCPNCKGRIYVEWGCLAECSCGFAEGARCKIHGEYDPDLPHCPDCCICTYDVETPLTHRIPAHGCPVHSEDDESEFYEENPPYIPPDEGIASVELCPYCGSDNIHLTGGWANEPSLYKCWTCHKVLFEDDLFIIPPQTIRTMDQEPEPLEHIDSEHGCTLSEVLREEL